MNLNSWIEGKSENFVQQLKPVIAARIPPSSEGASPPHLRRGHNCGNDQFKTANEIRTSFGPLLASHLRIARNSSMESIGSRL